ncbi:hypothetical protein IPJ70_03240 [Candidatus Campbellbacteria bacterium]|nr:MAG: hypothetical protein IPJ70_03240 [Candidatus Campbellbacteria bacterium]
MKKYYILVLFVCVISPLFARAEDVIFQKVLRTYDQNGYNSSWGSRAFEGTAWLSGGDLIVTGSCKQDHTGGAFLFGSDGVYKGIGNTCSDTSSIRLGCSEAGGCQLGTAIAERPDGSIVRLGQSRNFVRRSPAVYTIASDGLSFVSRLFFQNQAMSICIPKVQKMTGIHGQATTILLLPRMTYW